MERLTESCGDTSHFPEKFGTLEDLGDQNSLLKLPCNVGDKIYYASKIRNAIFEYVVHRIIIESDGVYIMASTTDFNADDFGKTVFLSKKKARLALKGMRKNNEID